jgi:hypothetical protein
MTNPKYPVYIISKGRHETMITSRSLNRMRVPHYISVEPQDLEPYQEAVKKFNLDMVTLLELPFSNHGDGPGRARNWCWDHSISIGAEKHWVLDDNISDFYRLHKNERIRVESGVIFKVAEDFVDRFENVPISGFQYRFFIAPNQSYPPYVKNTRIYSTLLISNDCKHRWRGRYNEDTDICLRVLKDGDCTIQFNAFLQGKAATQTVKGGNTEEFYHKEGIEKNHWVDGVNAEGTRNKSEMLVRMHPDVARMVWRYKRWHHYVDYSPFKKNELRYLLVNDLTYRAVNDGYVMIFEGHFKRNYIHVRDVCEAFLHAIHQFENMKSNIYNVGLSSANVSKLELCDIIKKHIPSFTVVSGDIKKDPDQRNYIVSNEKLEATGWVPYHTLDDGVEELIKGYTYLKNNIYGNV